MSDEIDESFFSIDTNFINTDHGLTYDIYINSSTIADSKRFIKIFSKETVLSNNDITNYRSKYGNFYVREKQRNIYLQSILERGTRYGKPTDTPLEIARTAAQVGIIKDFAIHHLNSLFSFKKESSNALLSQALEDCHETVTHMVSFVKDYNIAQIQELIGHLSFHDFYTYDHSINVSMYCISMLKTHNPKTSEEELIQIGFAGLLHDLGKMEIPTEILNKPGNLTPEEFQIVKKHPQDGVGILDKVTSVPEGVDLEEIKKVIIGHHENYDGSGYPYGITNDDLNLYTKITTLADVFDALTTKRTYQAARSIDEALSIMDKSCKKKFDPKIFEILTKNTKKLIRVHGANELADDFDPSVPYEKIPFKTSNSTNSKIDIFGKEDISWKQFGKVKVEK